MTDDDREMLHKRLVHLGDLIGDGEHHEKGGGWISREYKKTLYSLYPEMRPKKDFSNRDNAVSKWCEVNKCRVCGGELRQTRKGSLRVICKECNTKFQLSKI